MIVWLVYSYEIWTAFLSNCAIKYSIKAYFSSQNFDPTWFEAFMKPKIDQTYWRLTPIDFELLKWCREGFVFIYRFDIEVWFCLSPSTEFDQLNSIHNSTQEKCFLCKTFKETPLDTNYFWVHNRSALIIHGHFSPRPRPIDSELLRSSFPLLRWYHWTSLRVWRSFMFLLDFYFKLTLLWSPIH